MVTTRPTNDRRPLLSSILQAPGSPSARVMQTAFKGSLLLQPAQRECYYNVVAGTQCSDSPSAPPTS